jgi:hypothetical protein
MHLGGFELKARAAPAVLFCHPDPRSSRMATKILTRLGLSLFLVAPALLAMIASSSAGQGSGVVVTYHLNGSVAGRGACIRTNPALPGNGWACVWDINHLYREINAVLSAAYVAGKTCIFAWSNTDSDGNAIIDVAECD